MTLLIWVVRDVQIRTGTLDLYCNENKQVMKPDRVSIFSWNKCCRLRVNMKWNIQSIICLHFIKGIKPYTLISVRGVCLNCSPVTSSCLELSGDAVFKSCLVGRLWSSYKTLDYVPGELMHGECCNSMKVSRNVKFVKSILKLTFLRRNYFFNFSSPCIKYVNNAGTKYVRIMKQTAFWGEKTESI